MYQLVYETNCRPARIVLQRTADTIVYGRRLPLFSTLNAANIVREALANPNIVVIESEKPHAPQ